MVSERLPHPSFARLAERRQLILEGDRASGGLFSLDGRYRYALWRRWEEGRSVVFVLLNPSAAGAVLDDPTVRRCRSFSRSWGYGGLVLVNLFALRARHPAELRRSEDPVGEANDAALALLTAAPTVLGWGNHGRLRQRSSHVLSLLSGRELLGLGTTRLGEPRHPLYLRGSAMPRPFLREGDVEPNRRRSSEGFAAAEGRPIHDHTDR